MLNTDIADGIATVTLNRPDVRNAFNDELVAALHAAFTQIDARDDVRVVVLSAHGPMFCAGADLHWMRQMASYSPEQNEADARRMADMLHAIASCRYPVIARVHGDAYAGGVGLVAACDIAVASTDACFALTEVKLGLIPGTISPYVLSAIGASAARRYMLTAERFDAAEAYRIGLVRELVPPDALDDAIGDLVDALMHASPQAIAATKRLIAEVCEQPMSAQLRDLTAQRIAQARASDDGKEGLAAFLEKRKPRWACDA
ncbi:MAG TPA: enoyl-CoA hydratase/isomerase family protein [Burkholderiaceae bacterium]|nr:enoyl-CoA hydratase/isomerase family protein [Burkholderiaceae bacterium]